MTPQELKNSILQLAIQGKLVEQRPEEGTATELLRDILTQRRRDAEVGRPHPCQGIRFADSLRLGNIRDRRWKSSHHCCCARPARINCEHYGDWKPRLHGRYRLVVSDAGG